GRREGRAEEAGVETLLLDEPGEDVGARLRQRRLERQIVGGVDVRRPETAGRGSEVGDARSDDRARDLAAERRGLREHAERVLDEVAAVVLEEDEGLHTSFRSARNATILSGALP